MVHRLGLSWRGALLGVLAALATVGFAVPAAASAAGPGDGGPGNIGAAKDCEKGGYVNYATTAGTKFKDMGQCKSYEAQGGTLVPLPDIALVVNCQASNDSFPGKPGEQCAFGVKNVGIGTANGTVLLDAVVAINGPYLTQIGMSAFAAGNQLPCISGSVSSARPTMVPARISAANICTVSLAPGAEAPFSDFAVGVGAALLQPGTVTADIFAWASPSFLVSRTDDDEFSQTFTFTVTPA